MVIPFRRSEANPVLFPLWFTGHGPVGPFLDRVSLRVTTLNKERLGQMYFVRAKRNKKIVTLPAPNGKQEAAAMRLHLVRFGWDAKVIEPKEDK